MQEIRASTAEQNTDNSAISAYEQVCELLKDYDPLRTGMQQKGNLLDQIWQIVNSTDKFRRNEK